MGLDTKSRPTRYEDVLGQDATKQILRQIVVAGAGCRQSYIFAGPYGTGKTTLARILARAILCASPAYGDPCDQCESCRRMLDPAGNVDFVEVDAATRSGKADVLRVLEDLAYDEGMGRRRLYLWDESHQLSTDALDAMLIPMEEVREGTRDKRLVNIFCTTEADKMRPTILSRCAPIFRVRPVQPEELGAHLARICDREGIAYEFEALVLTARATECHVRDALKAVEAAATMGGATLKNLAGYLGLDSLDAYAEVLEAYGNPVRVAEKVRPLLEQHSAGLVYQKLADLSLSAFLRASGAPASGSWPTAVLDRLAPMGQALLGLAERLGARPGRPTLATLICDLASPVAQPVLVQPSLSPRVQAEPNKIAAPGIVGGLYIDPRAKAPGSGSRVVLSTQAFASALRKRIGDIAKGNSSKPSSTGGVGRH